ncbi:MAG TPA: hypothetical protein VJ946_03645, partial [Bacteroidales bacterium]|nr:hypothetical protein [Bacteroidales bacterium]
MLRGIAFGMILCGEAMQKLMPKACDYVAIHPDCVPCPGLPTSCPYRDIKATRILRTAHRNVSIV